MKNGFFEMAVLSIAVSMTGVASASSLYTFTTFDGPGNNAGGTTVNAINNNGELVGFSSDNAATPTLLTNFIRATNGTVTTLNVLNDPLAMANGINNAGITVGTSSGKAFVSSGTSSTLLPPVSANATNQVAFGINDSSKVVGQYLDTNTGNTPGFFYNGSQYASLSPVANAAVVNAQNVNDNGLVAGFYSTDGEHQHGFFYNSNNGTFTLPPDPVVANLFLTQFLGVNDNGEAVGYYQTSDGSQHGFIYNIDQGDYAFLDDPNAVLTGLGITQITGINDSGEIAGFYVDANTGLQRGFFAVTAPEPASILLTLGTFPVFFLRRFLRTSVKRKGGWYA